MLNYTFSNPSLEYKNNDILLAKHLYVAKDLMFMFIILMASALNFSWLYFPFLFISVLCYFLLFKTSICAKKLKRIIEYFSLIYSLGILAIKIFYVITIKTDFDYDEFLLDLGMQFLLDKSSKFFMT